MGSLMTREQFWDALGSRGWSLYFESWLPGVFAIVAVLVWLLTLLGSQALPDGKRRYGCSVLGSSFFVLLVCLLAGYTSWHPQWTLTILHQTSLYALSPYGVTLIINALKAIGVLGLISLAIIVVGAGLILLQGPRWDVLFNRLLPLPAPDNISCVSSASQWFLQLLSSSSTVRFNGVKWPPEQLRNITGTSIYISADGRRVYSERPPKGRKLVSISYQKQGRYIALGLIEKDDYGHDVLTLIAPDDSRRRRIASRLQLEEGRVFRVGDSRFVLRKKQEGSE